MGDDSGLTGILLGAVVVMTIQLTIGNPFIWIAEKIEEWRSEE